jgi:hypothetical protein
LREDLKMLASKLKLNKWLLLSKLIISNIIAIGAHNLEPTLPLNSLEEQEAARPMPIQVLRTCQSTAQFVMSGLELTTFPCLMQDPQLRQK